MQLITQCQRIAIIRRKRLCLIEMSLQVFLMICKTQYSAKPTTGSQFMIVWAESVQGQVLVELRLTGSGSVF